MTWILLAWDLAYNLKEHQWINESLISLHINHAVFFPQIVRFAEEFWDTIDVTPTFDTGTETHWHQLVALLPITAAASSCPSVHYDHYFTYELFEESWIDGADF